MRIEIQLERPNGVFYAGEVVRGTVRLDCDEAVTCRGFFLRFRGKAHVRWHIGGGDKRVDYMGTTMFQVQEQTLLGSFYQTTLIYQTGENALVYTVRKSGIVNIPCDQAEQSDLKLAIRVMSYNLRNLGGIVLDVPSLARSKQKQSFSLTPFSKRGNGEILLSASFVPYDDAMFPSNYRSGLDVETVANKPLCLVLQVHHLKGLRTVDSVGQGNHLYIQVYRVVSGVVGKGPPKPQNKTVIRPGTFIFPFEFQLKHDAPGSAELGVGDQSYVRYSVRANISKLFLRDPSAKRLISVIPNRPLPSLRLLVPYENEIVDEPVFKCSCCCFRCCRLDGMVSTKLRVGRLAYAPGELVDVSESLVTNSTNKDLPLEIVLTNHVLMSSGMKTTTWLNRSYSLLKVTIGAKQRVRLGDVDGAANVRIPAVFPSFAGGLSPRSQGYDHSYYPCLRWSYTLDVRIGGQGWQSTVLRQAPVLICSAPPYAHSIEKARAIASPPNNPFRIFSYAITGPEFCDTAPTITGPEDGGIIAVATDVGPVNIWEDSEDNHLVQNPDTLTYQPTVNTFPQPLQSFAGGFSESGSQVAASKIDTDEVQELLAQLDGSLDCRRTVRDWVHQNPQIAAKLSPTDFQAILSKVTLSVEQELVIGELLSVFRSGGRLTCDHVVHALKVCVHHKGDLAKLMVPHVIDPENKLLVLDQLDCQFYRESIEREFRKH